MAKREDVRRIGLLVPSSNTLQEVELARALPSGTTLHTTRLKLTTVDPDSILSIVAELETESKKLMDADVDVILFAATAPSSRNGIGYDRKLIERITAATGKPATTASTALLEAFRVLNIRRISFGAPWGKAVNVTSVKFLEENGIRVVADEALGVLRNQDIGLLDPETARDMALRVDRPEADAVMLGCGNWRALQIVEELEKEIGKPVLTTNQVSLWHALKIAGSKSLPGYGMLLRDYMDADNEVRQAS